MTCVEAPAEYDGHVQSQSPSLFLAGGISNTHDWQAELIALLADAPVVILNPRRRNYPVHDPAVAEEQIAWEFRHLRRATAVLFWFPPETLCPIALFELGGRIADPRQPLFVGTHPDYGRRLDVEIQLRLARPEVRVTTQIEELNRQVRDWLQMS